MAADQRKSTTWQAFFELTKKKESKAKPSRAVDTNVRGGGRDFSEGRQTQETEQSGLVLSKYS